MIDPDLMLRIAFPDPGLADESGLVALGGNFDPEVLLVAYASGIFPWPSEELPYAWFSPDPRMLLRPSEIRISRSLARTLRRARFRVTFDTAFEAVIRECAEVDRAGQGGTWISEELQSSFCELHRQGFAHSVETWLDDRLVGGCYGLALGAMFCGESMFHRESDASKVAFVALARRLEKWNFHFVDCQIHTDHLASLGAEEYPRAEFLRRLRRALGRPTLRGSWAEPESAANRAPAAAGQP